MKNKRKRESINRKMKTMFKNAYTLGKLPDMDIALIICNRGQYFVYKSIERESFPPTIAQIVSKARVTLKSLTNIYKENVLSSS